MSIYDTLLGTVGQGYAQANQNAMAQAQMPTFADRFLAGLRQSQEDELKRKVAEGTLSMNQAYKLSQEQNMREGQQNNLLGRQTALVNAASNDLDPKNRPGWVKLFAAHGLPEELLPKQEFNTTLMPGEEAINPMTGMPEVSSGYGQTTAIPGTGYGSRYQQRNDINDLKWDIANLNAEQKFYLAQLKSMDPKSAAGKLQADLESGRLDPTFANAVARHMTAIIDPKAAAAASAGDMRWPSVTNAPTIFGQQPRPPYQQTDVAPSAPGGSPGLRTVERAANVPPGTLTTPPRPSGSQLQLDPLSPKGLQNQLDAQADLAKTQGAMIQLGAVEQNLNKAMALLDKGTGGAFVPGVGIVGRTGTPEGVALRSLVKSIQSGEVINQITAMKDSGVGLGRVTQMEWIGLGNLISSLDLEQDDATLKQNIKQIYGTLTALKAKLVSGSEAVQDIRAGVPPTRGGLGKPVATDREGKEVYKSGGKYVYVDGTEYKY